MAEFLTQAEVDSMLRAITGEDGFGPMDDEPADAIKPYNLAKQERIVRGRMPTLEIINERFARLLRIGLFDFMRRMPEISVGAVRVIKYNEFIRNLAVPTNLNLISLRPLRGNGLIILEPSLIFSMVDSLFGGDGRLQTEVEGREFSPTEQRIIARMLEVIFSEYSKAWAPVYPLKPEYIRSEMHTQFANIANPAEIVVSSTFEVELGDSSGFIHICIPYSSLEPIRDAMNSGVQNGLGEPDRRWTKMLKSQMENAEVELMAELATARLNFAEILSLRKGDFIPLQLNPHIQAKVDGVTVFDCSYGISGGQYALKVERLIKQGNSDADNPPPREKAFKSLSEVYSIVSQHGANGADQLQSLVKSQS